MWNQGQNEDPDHQLFKFGQMLFQKKSNREVDKRIFKQIVWKYLSQNQSPIFLLVKCRQKKIIKKITSIKIWQKKQKFFCFRDKCQINYKKSR